MSHNTKPTSTTTTTTTSRVNGTQACAACKYRRSKCASDCILAPYFPHDRHHQFRNAHKLFGVSNITKIIQNLDPQQKDAAMQTIIYQSDVRAADPVGGCFRIIQDLSHQIEVARAELDLVLQQLALCRAFAAAAAAPAQPLPPPDGSPVTEFDALDPLLGYDPNDHNQLHQSHGEEYILEENHAMPLQGGVGGAAGWTMQDDVVAAPEEAESGFSHEKESLVRECEDFKPAIIDLGEERLVLKFDHEEEIIQQSDEAISRDDKALTKDEFDSYVPKDEDEAALKQQVERIEEAQDHQFKHDSTLFTFANFNSSTWTS